MKGPFSRLLPAVLSLLILPAVALAADKVDLRHSPALLNAAQAMPRASVTELQGSKQAVAAQASSLHAALGLSAADGLSLARQHTDPVTGDLNLHFQQTFRGVPVWGESVIVTKRSDGTVRWMHGNAVNGLAQDIRSTKPAFSADDALARAKQMDRAVTASSMRIAGKAIGADTDLGMRNRPTVYRDESSQLMVYLDDQGKGHLAYVVGYYKDEIGGGAPSRPVYILDAHSGAVLKHFDRLATTQVGTGPGGNQKTGEYYYGQQYPKLDLTVSGSTYSYNNSNVRTVNLNHGTSGTTTFTNNSSDFTPSPTNGAYSPINDAQYMGGEVVRTYQDWVGSNPLSFKLVMRVHYSNNYENAFWDGSYMNFGDGASTFYPLVCFDVAGHEVSHGYTEQHSNLTYSGKSGGINEAFSDMAGEAVENHAKGSNDWMVGKDIYKGSGALRYMDNPPADGQSIDNVNDYYSGLDVHYSSGVFNKAFYTLATTSGWTTQKAFKLFAYANANYWTASATFVSAAQGVEDAASALGYSTTDVDNAFSVVGIDLGGGGGGGGGGTTALENGVPVNNISGASGSNTYFSLDVPSGASNLTFSISGGSGDADLYVKFGSQPTTSSYDCRPYLNGNSESCSFSSPSAGTYYVMIRGYSSYSGVSLVGSYDTGGGGGGGSCPSGYTQYTGSLSGSGDYDYQPAGNYYHSNNSGTHSGILTGPSGTDFDLYLQKWNGSGWSTVAQSISSTPNEQIDYSGSSGYYVWKVNSYSGSGSYSFCLKHPN